jgi:hypothetical protein
MPGGQLFGSTRSCLKTLTTSVRFEPIAIGSAQRDLVINKTFETAAAFW